jgi:predicted dehydrogenase
MMPSLTKVGGVEWRGLCTARGMNAEHSGRKMGFGFATTEAAEVFNDPRTHAVFVATRHDLHADLVIGALKAGKHVFVEKPLTINAADLTRVAACVEELGDKCPILMVGFNRRFAPATKRVKDFFAGVAPRTVAYRFASGYVPANIWPQDEEVGGGRIVGEGCHFIDLMAYWAGAPPVAVSAVGIGPGSAYGHDDNVAVTLRFADGSVGQLLYTSMGDPSVSKERYEVLCEGKVAVLDNWRSLAKTAMGKTKTTRALKADKGHGGELEAFVKACRRGEASPMHWDDIAAVTRATFAAVAELGTHA